MGDGLPVDVGLLGLKSDDLLVLVFLVVLAPQFGQIVNCLLAVSDLFAHSIIISPLHISHPNPLSLALPPQLILSQENTLSRRGGRPYRTMTAVFASSELINSYLSTVPFPQFCQTRNNPD